MTCSSSKKCDTNMIVLLLICFKALLTLSLGSKTSLPQVDKLCLSQKTCETRKNCPYIEKKYQQLENTTKGQPDYGVYVAELKQSICNKKKRAFCCPQCFTTETNESNGKINTACVFPFIYKGLSHGGCLDHPKLDGKWCSTKVNTEGIHIKGNWGFCRPECSQMEQEADNSLGNYLPSDNVCGGTANTGFIVGGTNTKPGEFPFNALLGYRGRCKQNEGCITCPHPMVKCIKYKCGGTLINRRYVLTAAHCHRDKRRERITEVVLGEWMVNNDPDCNFDNGNGSCTRFLPEVQKFNITPGDVTVHEDYGQNRDGSLHDDIALVRLPRLAQLNLAVQPVCLPWNHDRASQVMGLHNIDTRDIRQSGLLQRKPTVVGWGYTEFDPYKTELQGDFATGPGNVAKTIQQKLKIPLLPSEDCDTFSPTDKEICGAGQEGKGACLGDSGSGLYLNSAERSPPWFQVGIVSYGSSRCSAGYPTIYTRVSSYTRWIRANLKP